MLGSGLLIKIKYFCQSICISKQVLLHLHLIFCLSIATSKKTPAMSSQQTLLTDKKLALQSVVQNYQQLKVQGDPESAYILEAVQFLQNSIFTHSLHDILISFNGGKDATVILTLCYLALFNKSNQESSSSKEVTKVDQIEMPHCIYFKEPNPFPEMLDFTAQMHRLFRLQTIVLESKKYAKELTELMAKRPFKMVVMGSRKDDPFCQNLGLITKTDTEKGYPEFDRVNPIIKWDYHRVWKAIRLLGIPYCSLYNEGYSSIGNKDNTQKNPDLIKLQEKGHVSPSLAKAETQRVCRISDEKSKVSEDCLDQSNKIE